eukprot:scaffold107292_cov19-Prasinocladus_malaysianus.AAC.1
MLVLSSSCSRVNCVEELSGSSAPRHSSHGGRPAPAVSWSPSCVATIPGCHQSQHADMKVHVRTPIRVLVHVLVATTVKQGPCRRLQRSTSRIRVIRRIGRTQCSYSSWYVLYQYQCTVYWRVVQPDRSRRGPSPPSLRPISMT